MLWLKTLIIWQPMLAAVSVLPCYSLSFYSWFFQSSTKGEEGRGGKGGDGNEVPLPRPNKDVLLHLVPIDYPPKCLSLLGIPQGRAEEKQPSLLFFAFNDIQSYPVISALLLEAGEGEGGGKGGKENTEVVRRGPGSDTKTGGGERQRERRRDPVRDAEREMERERNPHAETNRSCRDTQRLSERQRDANRGRKESETGRDGRPRKRRK